MKALIIEDEAGSAKELSQVINGIDPSIRILSILESVEDALLWFDEHEQPDVIFSDIQLADGLSFEIYAKVHVTCPIIFCSAFDTYLMNAFESNAISYLLKPITKEKVAAALQKLKTLQKNFEQDNGGNMAIQNLLKQLKQPYKSTILVNLREKFIPVLTKDIAYFFMEHTVVEVATVQHQNYFMNTSLDELEKMVYPEQFYRANRQYLINRAAIANAERFFSRKLVVKLTVPTTESIVVSKAKASEFLHWLQYQ